LSDGYPNQPEDLVTKLGFLRDMSSSWSLGLVSARQTYRGANAGKAHLAAGYARTGRFGILINGISATIYAVNGPY
jgi:hypothetical protein